MTALLIAAPVCDLIDDPGPDHLAPRNAGEENIAQLDVDDPKIEVFVALTAGPVPDVS